MSSANLLTALRGRLSAPDRAVLDAAIRLAEGRAVALYLVGGSVRDLLLEREQLDLDIAVAGDAIDLAQALAAAADGRVAVHPSFGTASVKGPFFSVDLAQTRAEEYPHPGALPVVRPASLEEDLARRDFTVNAMALRLTRPQAGRLVDPHAGRQDLERRAIRVLHDGSFRDDATRMLRAVRYEGRLSFRLEDGTARLLDRDRRYLDTKAAPVCGGSCWRCSMKKIRTSCSPAVRSWGCWRRCIRLWRSTSGASKPSSAPLMNGRPPGTRSAFASSPGGAESGRSSRWWSALPSPGGMNAPSTMR